MAEVGTEKRKGYQIVDGFKYPPGFDPEAYRSIRAYKPHDGEVFLVTFPKCGTNWMTQIVYLIQSKGVPAKEYMIDLIPFLDLMGTEALQSLPKPKTSRSHMTFEATPWLDKAKYIYVARNPKDCLVSFYHFTCPNSDFNEYFDNFAAGEIAYGDYFDHVMSWYEHRKDPNVLFLTYESMKRDIKKTIETVAAHLGDEYLKAVSDESVMSNIIKYSSFEYMKSNSEESAEKLFSRLLEANGEDIDKWPVTASMKYMFKKQIGSKRGDGKLIRKGIIGDWRSMLSEEQSKRIDDKIELKLKGTEFWKEWNEIGCLK